MLATVLRSLGFFRRPPRISQQPAASNDAPADPRLDSFARQFPAARRVLVLGSGPSFDRRPGLRAVTFVRANEVDLDPKTVGRFDVVYYPALPNPLPAGLFDRIARVTDALLLVARATEAEKLRSILSDAGFRDVFECADGTGLGHEPLVTLAARVVAYQRVAAKSVRCSTSQTGRRASG
jgi:hypothetical protein